MIYEGNGFYTFYSSLGHQIKLSENDIHSILNEYLSTLEDDEQENIIDESLVRDYYKIDKRKRPHHPKEHIKKLVESYYDKTNIELNNYTKVFIKIANELKITPKAVNKAYYSK